MELKEDLKMKHIKVVKEIVILLILIISFRVHQIESKMKKDKSN